MCGTNITILEISESGDNGLFIQRVLYNVPESFATPWTVAHQAPLSMGFPRQEYWSGLPFPTPGDLPNPGIEPTSTELASGFITAEAPGKPLCIIRSQKMFIRTSEWKLFDKSLLMLSLIHTSIQQVVLLRIYFVSYYEIFSQIHSWEVKDRGLEATGNFSNTQHHVMQGSPISRI